MKIFISGTSSQFRSSREQLRSSLARMGHDVRVQEDFQTGAGLLLQRVQDYVAACDRVIVLLGSAFGDEATGVTAAPGVQPRSWTQWEYFFAIGERLDGSHVEARPLQLYVASDACLAARAVDEHADRRARQLAFVAEVKKNGRHWATFDSDDRLRALVAEDIRQIEAHLPPPIDDETFTALGRLEEDIKANRAPAAEDLVQVTAHAARNAREHALQRIAARSHARHAVDLQFTPLTLLLDQGSKAQQPRWQEQADRFHDLEDVLVKTESLGFKPVIVLLGPPGSGKSTLLRRLEYDVAARTVRGTSDADSWTLFASLGSFPTAGALAQDPYQWLAARWAGDYPHLPPFDHVCRSGHLTLLLDALNEIPHKGADDYAERVGFWRTFVHSLVTRPPRIRIVFSCRSLDYSQLLSSDELPVPQVNIEPLSDEQVQDFLTEYSPDHGDVLWKQLEGTTQLDLFRSPFYLRLLIDQAGDGKVPEGRATLFTAFVRRALYREIEGGHRLFQAGGLLDERDRGRVMRQEWRHDVDLPARGPLIPQLAALAFGMQHRREGGESTQVRVPIDECHRLIGSDRPDDVIAAGVALQLLDDDRRRDEVLFVHQLLQEFFAARQIVFDLTAETSRRDNAAAMRTVARLAATNWREGDLPPVQFQTDNDPLPTAPTTGWEETFRLAGPMVPDVEAFLSAVMSENLPLAGRVAAQPDVRVSATLRSRLQQALVERTRDADADLRARIAAARALGELGDPRFERRRGPLGEYLWPPLVPIDADEHTIGSDAAESYKDERPVHRVQVQPFSMARFPVTNAEWRLFMLAGGYEDEQWWETDAAKAWRVGEGTAEGPKAQARENRRFVQGNPGLPRKLHQEGRWTSRQVEDWEAYARMSDDQFEELLARSYRGGRHTQPGWWSVPTFNHASQPVVGICWFEARAYCAWLSVQSGQVVRLPTEVEWEAAARGASASTYAWLGAFDARRCNTFETHVRGTTPVGVLPGGDTPSGVCDMTGNVWEWTSSAYLDYPYIGSDGREDPKRDDLRRVVRGGSWFNSRDGARASSRYGFHPVNRDYYIGFRVVVSPHPRSTAHGIADH